MKKIIIASFILMGLANSCAAPMADAANLYNLVGVASTGNVSNIQTQINDIEQQILSLQSKVAEDFGTVFNPTPITSSTLPAGVLFSANNLSDVANSSTALTNLGGLGVGSAVTANYFPYWDSSTGLSGTSSMYQLANGNVGIGLTNPAYALDMAAGDVYGYNGTVMAQASTTLFSYFLGDAGTIGAAATGIRNTGVGYLALSHLTTGGSNTANGYASLYSNTTGGNNTANGLYSLYSNTTGDSNTANGLYSLYYNTTGGNNTANGLYSLLNNTTGGNNTANGYYSLLNNTTNIATLGAITGGSGYTPGTYTGVQMTLSSGSSATTYPIATIIASSTGAITSVVITTNGLGLKDTTTFLTAPASSLGGTGSGFNVAVASLSTGQYNTAYGYQAGRFISGGVGLNETSTYSTYIGYNAYPLASGDTNETVIGSGAVGSGSNTVTLGGAGTTGTIIPYGNVGIGTTAPSSTLHVVGTFQLSASSSVITPSLGGALTLGTCDSVTSSVDSTLSSSTAVFPSNYEIPEGGLVQPAQSYLTSVGVLTTYMCGLGVVTPTSTPVVVKIIR